MARKWARAHYAAGAAEAAGAGSVVFARLACVSKPTRPAANPAQIKKKFLNRAKPLKLDTKRSSLEHELELLKKKKNT